jgi:hypothetical protein
MALIPLHPTLPLGRPAAPRWRLPAVVALCVLAVGYTFGLTRTPRGWLTMALVVAVVALARGYGLRQLPRLVAEWAVVAVLAVLLATPFGPKLEPAQGHRAEASATGLCPAVVQGLAGKACHQLDRLIAKAKAAQTSPTTTTRPHRR